MKNPLKAGGRELRKTRSKVGSALSGDLNSGLVSKSGESWDKAGPALLRVFRVGIALICCGPAAAAEEAVPAPLTASAYTALLERPPFRRVLSLSDSLTLSGAATLPAGQMVTVWNRATGESFIVTATPNAHGWKLVELHPNSDLKAVSAVISAGGQEITLRFDPDRMAPPKLDNRSKPGRRVDHLVMVEALLRTLDGKSAETFESLDPDRQESFRKAFTGFLDTYPEAGDDKRIDFIHRALREETGAPPAGSAPAPVPAPAIPEPAPPAVPASEPR